MHRAKGREMNLVTRCLLTLATVISAACSPPGGDGKRFIGIWESAADPLRTVEVTQNGDNYLLTILKGVPEPAPDLAPEINTIGVYPAVLKNGMLEFTLGVGTAKVDVIRESGELVLGGDRFRRSTGPRRCSTGDERCKNLFDLYRMNPQFRDRFHSAMKEAKIVKPEWIPFGVTAPFTRSSVNGQQYIFSWIGEPHAVSHAFYIGYNETRGHVFGIYANEAGDRITFGARDEADICAHFERYTCGE